MKRERIIKVWKFVYIYLFTENGEVDNSKEMSYIDAHSQYDCTRIFWRFYWIKNIVDL